MAVKTYKFEDGKYEFDRHEDTHSLLAARRHGEDWPVAFEANRFDKSFHAMLNRIDELEALVAEVHEWIVCAAIASPEDMMQSAEHITEITTPEYKA